MRHQARVAIVFRNGNGGSTTPPKYCEQTVAHWNAACSRIIGSFKTRKKSLATQKLENLQKSIEGTLSDRRKTTQNGNKKKEVHWKVVAVWTNLGSFLLSSSLKIILIKN